MQGVLLLVTGIFTSIQCISALRTAVDVSPTHLSASRFSLDRPPTSRPNSDHVLCMSAVGEATDDPFSRKALLEGATKAAGVIGAGTFLQKGFISGVPYNGKPDLSGKDNLGNAVRPVDDFCRQTAIVTGGNTGLGKETAVRLAQLGADVTIACRNPDRAVAALEDIRTQAPAAKVEAMPLDLASLSSIDSFAKLYKSSSSGAGALDILVNNAGVMAIPERETTKEGFERQFGINHLGHFHLTSLLLPNLLKSSDARMVSVSSAAHLFADKVDWADLNASEPGAYGPWVAYGLSKLSNIFFAKELQRRVDLKGGAGFTQQYLYKTPSVKLIHELPLLQDLL